MDLISCYRKPVEWISEMEEYAISLVCTTDFPQQPTGSSDWVGKWIVAFSVALDVLLWRRTPEVQCC